VVGEEEKRRPFVTIGVPTYNRHDLLRQTLLSILAQSFADFEVIVGNDYTAEVLTGEALGITDPRIRFVNHPRNLREVGNMNALLEMATGRYFTWLFDDDLYQPNFLQTAHDGLAHNGFPSAFFSSFGMLREGEEFRPTAVHYHTMSVLTGREFLGRYSARRPDVASTCGLFDTDALRRTVGGVEELCVSAIGVYCEYLFLVRCSLLERIVYADAPLVLFRIHPESWSESPSELAKYIEAGKELIRRCAEVLRHPNLFADYDANLRTICEQHLITIAHRLARLEVACNQFGIGGIFRALAKYLQEALQTRRAYLNEGGNSGFRSNVDFLKIHMVCWYIVVANIGSGAYRRLKRKMAWSKPEHGF
jgi:glycosyltransferase involved in cell wall biosynthesis